MKNKFLYLIALFVLISFELLAENLNIKSKNITVDKKSSVTIFKDEVYIEDEKKNIIKSDYAEYDKKKIQSNLKTMLTLQMLGQ